MRRAERRHRSTSRIQRRLRVLAACQPDLLGARPQHMYAKRRPLGCGNPRCGLCRMDRKEVRRRRALEAHRKTGQTS